MIEGRLKDYLIYRHDERECHREIAGESDLESEAIRFAALLAQTEPEELDGICYEVRLTATGELIEEARATRTKVGKEAVLA